ncbi:MULTISPECIES: flagellar hook-basal body complex protein FliE [Paenibacillus]|uniref:Flagellar hook-basal body complex protein FliE n=2 Tax=Paenibacillus lactis TaxID=228574 RepID=G4HBQ3_9BACL|nr:MULTISPECIES: flagellar hook-basal body complex protein FliE [Paenibacillus]EHB67362.1 flagellar hook-basal body complex subunit FliE [Paenibacillus lactis 154]MBP1894617.1 flagellar hook-basal body complex protein FliE [Paenibacillus lactis]MCM3496005.1 flagellar hook-basal body complex protein FliE [Paenibacillus lactis]GIO93288.1 flagellar hook-basal body complex protein FliE [Paenibacillus lactis]HAF98535.1 flagellar hook-basal body complex protein FliE [Paenibacillus lactis]
MIQNTMFQASGVSPLQMREQATVAEKTPAESIRSFGSYLSDALNSVSAQEQQAHVMSDKMMIGQVNVDQAMISAQQALLSIQLTTQVRNKVVEAYQEIMRTQI